MNEFLDRVCGRVTRNAGNLPFVGATLLIVCSWSNLASAAITQDTTISDGSIFNGHGIGVADGNDGPTTVNVIAGGNIAGFGVSGNSRLILDGGLNGYLSGVTDAAQFFIYSGSFGCFEQVCQVIDYDADLTAEDQSQLHFFGGQFDGLVRIWESSSAHIYGRDLLLESVGGPGGLFLVTGKFASGEDISLSFHKFQSVPAFPHGNQQIILHEIPEPISVVLVAIGIIYILIYRQQR